MQLSLGLLYTLSHANHFIPVIDRHYTQVRQSTTWQPESTSCQSHLQSHRPPSHISCYPNFSRDSPNKLRLCARPGSMFSQLLFLEDFGSNQFYRTEAILSYIYICFMINRQWLYILFDGIVDVFGMLDIMTQTSAKCESFGIGPKVIFRMDWCN